MIDGTVGVAVKNALPEVIEKASAVAESNRKDGVALFLQENLLERKTNSLSRNADIKD